MGEIISPLSTTLSTSDTLLTALRSTEDWEVIQFIAHYRFDHEFDVNESNEEGVTMLMLIASLDETALVQRLIHAGAEVNIKSKAGWTALMYAIVYDRLGVILLLINHNTQIVHLVDNLGETPLMLSAVKNNSAAVKALIKAGADVDAVTSKGYTALMIATYHDHINLVTILIEAGADVNKAQNKGMTALMWAAHEGYTNIATVLINAEADLNKVNLQGETALALAQEEKHYPIVRVLEAKQMAMSKKAQWVTLYERLAQIQYDIFNSNQILFLPYQELWQFIRQLKQELQNILASNAFSVPLMPMMLGIGNEETDHYSSFEARVVALETHKKGYDIALNQEKPPVAETASSHNSPLLARDRKRKGKEEKITEVFKRPRIEETLEDGINISHSMRQMFWLRSPEMTEQFPEDSIAQSNLISIDPST